MKIKYQDIKIGRANLEIVTQANTIIKEYQAQGFILTLRQLYYQFVSRDLLPNTIKSYKRLGGIVNDARMAGLLSWEAIEDRTRNLRQVSVWNSPADIVRACARQFKLDLWDSQDYRPEVWIEKDALVGVIQDVCNEFRVPYFACRGYNSQSEQWAAGRRFLTHIENGQIPIVLHLGDHDPSGIDMTRDNADRLSLFAQEQVEVQRLALNWSQIEEYQPPPNPAKATDSRYEGYQSKFGDESWELDALEPRVIEGLVRDAIQALIDPEDWDSSLEKENQAKARLEQSARVLEDEEDGR